MKGDPTDRALAVGNIVRPSAALRAGAKAYVVQVPGNPESVEVEVQSRGGRWVRQWVRAWDLANLRVVTIPPAHPKWLSARSRTGAETDVRRIQIAQSERTKPRGPGA
jgi:DNA-binding transcriptional regulator LsrR (DeoR family)